MATLRVPFALGSGGILSLSIFWVLWVFVDVPMDIRDVAQPIRIEFSRTVVATTPAIKRPPQPQRKPPRVIIDPVRVTPVERGLVAPTPYEPPQIFTRGLSPTMTPGQDRDAIPLVRVQPDYPPRALRDGAEGWVQVQFSITPTGAVKDPFVVGAQPKNLFEDAALKAIARWRYQPKVEDGVAVERVGVQTVIRFALDEQ